MSISAAPTSPSDSDPVLLLCAHGSTKRSAQVATASITSAVSAALPGTEVILTWVDVQEPDVQTRCAQFADRPVVIVPLLLAAGFHVHHDLAQAVEKRAHHVVTAPLGPDRGLSELMAHRIAQAESELDVRGRGTYEIAQDSPCEDRPALVLVAAGSSEARAVADVHRQAADLAEFTGREVRTGFVSAAQPSAREAMAQAWCQGVQPVTVVSFHVAPGVFHDAVLSTAQTLVNPETPTDTISNASTTHPVLVTDPLLEEGKQVPRELVDVVVNRLQHGLGQISAQNLA